MSAVLRPRRSKLFVPGNRPTMMQKALATAADCLSLDLEDAVPADYKPEARRAIRTFLEEVDTDKEIVIRVNALNSGHFFDDVSETLCSRVDIINMPKVSEAGDLLSCVKFLDYVEKQRGLQARTRIMATIETAQGLANIHQIVRTTPRLASVQLGLGDLFSKHGMERNHTVSNHIRGMVRLAAATTELDTFDAAFLAVEDLEGFERDAKEAAAWGYCGKTCIHPAQVPVANRVFTPSSARIERAKEIVREYETRAQHGVGAFTLHGQLIDFPLYEEARRLVMRGDSIRDAKP